MRNKYKQFLFLTVLVLIFATFGFSGLQAGDKPDNMQGWENDSPYNQLYDVREYEKLERGWSA